MTTVLLSPKRSLFLKTIQYRSCSWILLRPYLSFLMSITRLTSASCYSLRTPQFVKVSDKVVDTFVKEPYMKQFYMVDVEHELEDYEPGRPCMKPDVLEEMVRIEEERRKEAEDMARNMASQGNIMIQQGTGPPTVMKGQDIIQMLKNQQEMINKLKHILRIKEEEIILMGNEILRLKSDAQASVSRTPEPSASNFESYLAQINK